MSKIIVTGATSFIGCNLINRLLDLNHEVLAVVRESSQKSNILPQHSHLKVLELNMENYYQLSLEIKNQYDVFISLAWNGTRGQDRNNQELQFNNYKYSLKGIKSAVKLGCKKIILAGSQAEYGVHQSMISETSECHPETEYGKYKLLLYLETMNFCKENYIRCIEPRFFSLYGPEDSDKTMIISVLKLMLNNEDCKLTLCKQLWNFMYISDAVDVLYKLITKNVDSGVYNLGNKDIRPLSEFIKEMKDLTGSKSRLLFGEVPYPPYGIVNLMPDINKLIDVLHWQPSVSFGNGINNIIKDLKQD